MTLPLFSSSTLIILGWVNSLLWKNSHCFKSNKQIKKKVENNYYWMGKKKVLLALTMERTFICKFGCCYVANFNRLLICQCCQKLQGSNTVDVWRERGGCGTCWFSFRRASRPCGPNLTDLAPRPILHACCMRLPAEIDREEETCWCEIYIIITSQQQHYTKQTPDV